MATTYIQPQPMFNGYPTPEFTNGSVPSDNGGSGPAGGAWTRDRAKIIDSITPQLFPFQNAIKKGTPGTQFDVRWLQRKSKPIRFLLNGAITNVATAMVVPAVDGIGFQQQYMVYQFEDNEEIVWGRALDIASRTVTIDRAQGGTTAAAHADGVGVRIIGTAIPQMTDHVFSPVAYGDYDYNYYQRFEGGSELDLAYEVFKDDEYDGNRMAKHLADEAVYQKKLYEQALIRGRRQAGVPAPVLSGRSPSMMGGFLQFIKTNDTNALGADLGYGLIEAELRRIQDKTDDLPTIMVGSFKTEQILGRLVKSRTATMETDRINFTVPEFDFAGFSIKFMSSRYMPDGVIAGVHWDKMEIVVKKGLDWHEKDIETRGDYKARTISSDRTLRVGGEETMFKLRNFSTDLTHYPETQFGGPVIIQS